MAGTTAATGPDPAAERRKAFGILFAVSVATALGNTGMQSVLPAIGRELRIPDFMIVGIFSLSAILWAVTSPIWARASDKRGRKPMIMMGLAGFAVSMLCCGLVVSAGLHRLAPPMVIFVIFLFARALFGTFGSASNPATQAYMAERTSRSERTQTMAGLAGAFGLGTVVGPAVAPLFIFPIVGLAGPMYTFSVIALATLFVVWKGLEERSGAPGAVSRAERRYVPAEAESEARKQPFWKDEKLRPFLVYGFLLACCQTALSQTLGFMIIDKLGLPPLKAQGFITVAMMAGAVTGLLAQWGLIRMFRMTPRSLMRWGAGLAAAANLLTAFAPDYWAVVVGYALASLGFSFARPGFTAGASLSVGHGDQARAAGSIAAVNGVNVTVAPLFMLFYHASHKAPFLVTTAILAGLVVYAFRAPMLRNVGDGAATEDDAVVSALEKAEEGGV